MKIDNIQTEIDANNTNQGISMASTTPLKRTPHKGATICYITTNGVGESKVDANNAVGSKQTWPGIDTSVIQHAFTSDYIGVRKPRTRFRPLSDFACCNCRKHSASQLSSRELKSTIQKTNNGDTSR